MVRRTLYPFCMQKRDEVHLRMKRDTARQTHEKS